MDFEEKWVRIGKKRKFVPKSSQWEQKCNFFGCKIIYFPKIDSYFCNQWECKFNYPIIVLLMTILSMTSGYWLIYDLFSSDNRLLLYICFTTVFFIWIISYFCAMCRSPGYLPYFWAVQGGSEYSFEEQMNGLITSEEQFSFAFENERPERGTLSKQAKRLILRADHICVWVSNWIGLKNYRYFFMKLIWTLFIFIFWYYLFSLKIYKIIINGWETSILLIWILILLIPISLLFIFFLNVFLRHFSYLIHNNTTLQDLKNERDGINTNPYDIGCCNNCIETIGPFKYFLFWFLPIPLPRTNNGINWKRNDQVDNSDIKDIEYTQPIPKKEVIYAPIEEEEEEIFEEIEIPKVQQCNSSINFGLFSILANPELFQEQNNDENSYESENELITQNLPLKEQTEIESLNIIPLKNNNNLTDNSSITSNKKKKMRKFDKEKDSGKKTYIKVKKETKKINISQSTPNIPKLNQDNNLSKKKKKIIIQNQNSILVT